MVVPRCSPFTRCAILKTQPSVIDPPRLLESPMAESNHKLSPGTSPPITQYTFQARPCPHHVEVCTHLHTMQVHIDGPHLNTTHFSQSTPTFSYPTQAVNSPPLTYPSLKAILHHPSIPTLVYPYTYSTSEVITFLAIRSSPILFTCPNHLSKSLHSHCHFCPALRIFQSHPSPIHSHSSFQVT